MVFETSTEGFAQPDRQIAFTEPIFKRLLAKGSERVMERDFEASNAANVFDDRMNATMEQQQAVLRRIGAATVEQYLYLGGVTPKRLGRGHRMLDRLNRNLVVY